jgi:CubicO group peptidase (beta-lactamase class C family)
MRVLCSPAGSLNLTVPAERPITFEDLLTHRSGLTYGGFHAGPIAKAYREALGGDIDSEVAPDAWIARLAALPLIDQPGAAFHYGRSTDLLGLLIARMEDAPLDDVLERRIFGPLEMKDTSFIVPLEKRGRWSGAYGFDGAGRLTALHTLPGDAALPEGMAYVSGGQGLWSTLEDYLAFARMFLGKGAVDGVRLLRPTTLAPMTSNRLTEGQRATSTLLGIPVFATGHGFRMGVAVVMEPRKAAPSLCGGSGAVGWPSAFGGWWTADPNDGSVMIFLAHSMVDLAQLADGIGLGVYAAREQFAFLATALRRESHRLHHRPGMEECLPTLQPRRLSIRELTGYASTSVGSSRGSAVGLYASRLRESRSRAAPTRLSGASRSPRSAQASSAPASGSSRVTRVATVAVVRRIPARKSM